MAFRTEKVDVVGLAPSARVFQAVAGDLEVVVTVSGGSVQIDGVPLASSSDGVFVGSAGEPWFRFPVRPGDELWAIRGSTGDSTVTVFVRTT